MLGLGLSLPRSPAVDIRGWNPLLLGEALIDILDPTRTDLITRPVGGLASSWRTTKGGYDFAQGTSAARPVWNEKSFGGRRNKLRVNNVDIQTTTGIGPASSGAVLRVVYDMPMIEELAARDPYIAALLNAGEISGWVLEYDNSAGSGISYANISRTPQDPSPLNYATTAMCRKVSGPPGEGVGTCLGGVSCATANQAATYSRSVVTGLGTVSSSGQLRVAQGCIGRFFMYGLYEGLTAPPNDVVIKGTDGWGFGRPGFSFDGGDDALLYQGSTFFPVGSAPMVAMVSASQDSPGSEASARFMLGCGAGSHTSARRLCRAASGGANRVGVQVGTGAGSNTWNLSEGDFTGRHVARMDVGSTSSSISLDGGTPLSQTFIPATSGGRAAIGATEGLTNYWLGQIAHVAFIDPTHPNWTPENAARLLAFHQDY